MANQKLEYAASAAISITLANLASDTNLLAGRESSEVSNTSDKYSDFLIAGKITTGTSPTTGRNIEVWAAGLAEDSTYPDVLDGTDSDETISGPGTKGATLKLVASIATVNTSDKTYWFGPVSLAALFGGVVPKKWVIFVVHNTGVNLNSTGSNHAIWYTPVYSTLT